MLLVLLAVVVVLLIGLDRVGLLVAESQIASRVQKSQDLTHRPDVSINGFPFLSQVISGRYGEVDVAVRDVTQNGLTVDRVSVRAHGVSVPLSKVLSGSVREVPVERADATVTLSYAHVNQYIADRVGEVLTVSSDGTKLKLTGTLPFPPRISLSAEARVDVSSSAITLHPANLNALLARIPGSSVARSTVDQFFTVRIPISQLPFGIRLRKATIGTDSVVLDASATGLTLRAPSG